MRNKREKKENEKVPLPYKETDIEKEQKSSVIFGREAEGSNPWKVHSEGHE